MLRIGYLLLILTLFGCKTEEPEFKYSSNYVEGLELSEKLDRPIFLYFTAYGSRLLSTSEFNETFLKSRKVRKILKEDYITIQLITDDKTPVEINDTLNLNIAELNAIDEKVNARIRTIRNKGQVNNLIQISFFKSNSQPLYVIMDAERNLLTEGFGYTSKNKSFFYGRLKSGLEAYRRKKNID